MSAITAIESPFMDVEQCAAYIGAAVQTVYRWHSQGRIPGRKLNGLLRFDRREIDAWSREREESVKNRSPSRFQAARERLRSLKTEHTADDPSRSPERRPSGNR